MTAASIGYGARFSLGNGASPEVFTDLAEVVGITPPSDKIDVLDATHMRSPNRTREFITGLIDPGECAVEMNFVPGSAADLAIQALKGTGTVKNCRITFPNGNTGAVTWTFAGILTGYTPTLPNDGVMKATATFKVTSSYVAGVAP